MQQVWRRALGRFRVGAVACALSSFLSSNAQAAGVEDTVGGTIALGRAANYARVNDFMATWQNPANLAIAANNAGAELRLPLFSACFDRARNRNLEYKPDPSGPDDEHFDEECNEAFPIPAGNAGFTLKLNDELGIGAGFFTPAGVGNLKFGDDRVVTIDPQPEEMYDPTVGGKSSPNRFMLLDRSVLAGFLSVGAGYAPIPELRVGVSLSAGFADVHYRNVASLGPGFTGYEVVNDVKVRDLFIPRATLSVSATPIDAIDVVGTFTWNADIEAEGTVDIRANGLQNVPRGDCLNRPDPAKGSPYCRIDDIKLDVPYQRFEVLLGVRYADRRVARGTVLDPMTEENWDIELDGYWVNTAHVKDFSLQLYDPNTPAETWPRVAFSSAPGQDNASSLPADATLPHNWKDTYGVRLGGDYNIIPSELSVRAGAAYETSAVRTEYMNIDYWPVQKIALHIGVTYRLGSVDLSAAYAHIFNETVEVKVGEGKVNQVVALLKENALPVNEGTYTSSIDVISVQGTYRF